jgi:hypothetical protein
VSVGKWINSYNTRIDPGQMTSTASCAGVHNEVWSAGAPSKMTETFQDVSTARVVLMTVCVTDSLC